MKMISFAGLFSMVFSLIKKFKYNMLALMQVIFGAVFSILIMKYFGVSAETDAFFITVTIFASLELVLLLFVDMFMQVYNDIKAKNKDDAIEFHKACLWFSVLVGLVFVALSIFIMDYIVMVFLSGSDVQRAALVESYYKILLIGLAFRPFVHVNTKMLNAEKRFSAPYIFTMVPQIFGIAAIIFFAKDFGIKALVFSQAFAWVAVFFFGLAYLKGEGFPIGFRLTHPKLWYFVKLSFKMRASHNMYGLLRQPITTNLLVLFPTGCASYFYYAQRFCGVITSVASGPILRIHTARLSKYWARNNKTAIKRLIKDTELKAVSLVVVAFIASLFFLKPVLTIVGGKNLSTYDIKAIYIMYLLLFLPYLLLTIEGPVVVVGNAAKRPGIFFITNTIFAVIYGTSGLLLSKTLGFYSIPIAHFIGQIFCFASYSFYNLRLLDVAPLSFAKAELIKGLKKCIPKRSAF
jgi:peptidoglycan biosynthesis protein MviN/MurJ (putative lipid II flippase)